VNRLLQKHFQVQESVAFEGLMENLKKDSSQKGERGIAMMADIGFLIEMNWDGVCDYVDSTITKAWTWI